MSHPASPALIQALLAPDAYPHAVTGIQLVETHISWVLLTGPYAYKIKKPVDFGFLDFSTLDKRRCYCLEELRVNRRLAPELYLEVVTISGSPQRPQVGGGGEPLEYAVKMRQFDTRQEFDQLLARDELSAALIDDTAQVLAEFHAQVVRADAASPCGTPDAIEAPVTENFQQMAPCLVAPPGAGAVTQQLDALRRWSEARFNTLTPLFAARKAHGFVRECHGDLHLRNIVLWEGRVTPFDAIEFNPNLRWIDVMSELAFLLMDLDDHHRHDLAQRLLNAYLEITGDYAGLALLRYYQVYRALVRAKVACLRLAQTGFADDSARREMAGYIALAAGYTEPPRPRLILNHGLSGSGKTTVAQQLLERTDLIRLRSDVERKRLFGLAARAASGSRLDAGIYQAAASEQTYQRLRELAAQLLDWGYPVLVDAAFLKAAQREPFLQLATAKGIPVLILHCEASPDILRARVQARSEAGRDASEADLAVLERQLQTAEPLTQAERGRAVTIDTTAAPRLDPVLTWLAQT